MSKQTDNPFDMTGFFESWMKSVTGMWSQTDDGKHATQTHPAEDAAKAEQPPHKARQDLAKTLKNWKAMASAMGTPESVQALMKGSGAMPDIMLKLTQTSMDSYMELQQSLIRQLSRMGESVQAYRFEEMDESIFRIWTDIYEREFRQFFKVPQLGLMREYQEKAYEAADTYNLFQAHLAEFLRLLSLPFGHALQVMQEEVVKHAEEGDLPEDARAYYQMWVKVLEGHFMTLFQTPEYVEALARTINTLADYAAARDAALEDMIGVLPVARKSEVDDMAREFYEMKKRLKRLEKKVDQLS